MADKINHSQAVADKARQANLQKEKARDRHVKFDAPSKAATNNNRLRRETPFISTVRFRNDLPEIPCDPKMLIAPPQLDKLAQFRLTSLEREPELELILEPDLGIPITLLDANRYTNFGGDEVLAPEDAALLESEAAPLQTTVVGKQTRDRLRGDKAELSWLMRTSYISNDFQESRAQGLSEKQAKSIRNSEDVGADDDTEESRLAFIEESFAVAQETPVHQTKPHLQPVEVLPVFPDFARANANFLQLLFDSEPTADHPRLSSKSAADRKAFAERAILKSFTLNAPDGSEDKFVAYMVPASDEAVASSSGVDQYEWVREYSYDIKADDGKTFLFRFEKDEVTYLDLNTKLAVQKKARQTFQEFPRPSHITLKRNRPVRKDEGSEDSDDDDDSDKRQRVDYS